MNYEVIYWIRNWNWNNLWVNYNCHLFLFKIIAKCVCVQLKTIFEQRVLSTCFSNECMNCNEL